MHFCLIEADQLSSVDFCWLFWFGSGYRRGWRLLLNWRWLLLWLRWHLPHLRLLIVLILLWRHHSRCMHLAWRHLLHLRLLHHLHLRWRLRTWWHHHWVVLWYSRHRLIHSWLRLIHSWLRLVHGWLRLTHSRLRLIHTGRSIR